MCGIIGYTGATGGGAVDILIKGLTKLEYRGYDSAGISIYNAETGKIDVCKKQGKLEVLSRALADVKTASRCGIGHTRWATHGKPSDVNAHPHLSDGGRFAVAHNGIIENHVKIRELLTFSGKRFYSETDSEVIPNLLEHNYDGDLLKAVRLTAAQLKGSYALCIMCRDYPDTVVAVKKESPLVIAVFPGGAVAASDPAALASYADKVYIPENDDIAVIRPGKAEFFNRNSPVKRTLVKNAVTGASVSKAGYSSFMYKEMMQIPLAAQDTVEGFKDARGLKKLSQSYLKRVKSVRFIGCGTAYHAGLVAAEVLGKLCPLDTRADIASEFRYARNSIDKRTLCVFISQSGETADTLGAVKTARDAGCKTAAVTNVAGSSITRAADCVIPTRAGPEIAVASTKAYNAQLAALYPLCLYIAATLGFAGEEFLADAYAELLSVGEKSQKALNVLPEAAALAKVYADRKCIFYIGRSLDYAVVREGSLKLKEIAYILSEAYPSGELKHGTLALIEKGTAVVAVITQKNLMQKSLSALYEIKARGGEVILITTLPQIKKITDAYDRLILLPEIPDLFAPLISVIPLQLFAYFAATEKGYDPDRPRNLAKSVTVE